MTTYEYVTIHVPGSTATIPQALNASGEVTGYFYDGSHYQGFIYSNGVYTTIAPPGSTDDTFPQGINDSGEVVGYDPSGTHSFIYNNGVYTTVTPPGSQGALALGINASREVTGYFSSGGLYEGFIYNNGVYTTLDVPGSRRTFSYRINASGEVTGYFDSNSDTHHGFIYNNGVYTTLDVPGSTETVGVGINDSGEVAGSFFNGDQRHGFIYNNGVYTTLDVPGSTQTNPLWINALGEVTGYFYDASHYQGFIYNNGVYTTIDVPGSTQTAPQWINDSGEVTGVYTAQSGQQEGFIAIPRPPAPTLSTPADGSHLNNNRPAISGTGEANDLATIYINGNVAGTTSTDPTGHWSFTPATVLSDGSYSAKATETDAAGNTSDFSNIDTFAIDTPGPASNNMTLWEIGYYEKVHHGSSSERDFLAERWIRQFFSSYRRCSMAG